MNFLTVFITVLITVLCSSEVGFNKASRLQSRRKHTWFHQRLPKREVVFQLRNCLTYRGGSSEAFHTVHGWLRMAPEVFLILLPVLYTLLMHKSCILHAFLTFLFFKRPKQVADQSDLASSCQIFTFCASLQRSLSNHRLYKTADAKPGSIC